MSDDLDNIARAKDYADFLTFSRRVPVTELDVTTRNADLLRVVLLNLGLDMSEPGLMDTPLRVAKMLEEFNQPGLIDEVLRTDFAFEESAGCMIVQKNIPFKGLCEHHLAPFFGRAIVGYVPRTKVVGLSKLTRLVLAAGVMRPSMQETITEVIASRLMKAIQPLGVMVVTDALHTCMCVRGIDTPDVKTMVSNVKGIYRDVPAAREEFLALARL